MCVYGHRSIQILTRHLSSYLNCMKCLALALNKTFISKMDSNGLGVWCKEPEPAGCSSALKNLHFLLWFKVFFFISVAFWKKYGVEYIHCSLIYMCLEFESADQTLKLSILCAKSCLQTFPRWQSVQWYDQSLKQQCCFSCFSPYKLTISSLSIGVLAAQHLCNIPGSNSAGDICCTLPSFHPNILSLTVNWQSL